MEIQVIMFKQDDPLKCTAAKLVKFGIAKQVRNTFGNNMILNPFATEFVLRSDRDSTDFITAIDCSWEFVQGTFAKKFFGFSRKLPPLLAGNPVNYSKIGKLTTAEAIAGTLYILNYEDLADEVINKFKWGHTFVELNNDLIRDYYSAKSSEDIIRIAREYDIWE